MGFTSKRPPVSETHPHLVAQTDGDLSTVTAGSEKKFAWRCDQGHTWEALVSSRCRGSGCPYCSGRLILPGFNDLATTHPGVAAECLEDPTTVRAGTDRKIGWRCAEGHEWEAPPYVRTTQGSGCPYCSGRLPIVGENDLATTHPDIAAQCVEDPTTLMAGTSRKIKWRCAAGHEWEAPVYSRANGAGCPMCAGQRVIPGVNDLQTLEPELARQALFDPTQVMVGSHQKLMWRCAEGHEWEAFVYSRTGDDRACPMCAGQRVIVGVNDLQTKYPDVAREALFDPTQVMWGSNQQLAWRCPIGHEYKMRVADRTTDAGSCPYCSGKRVLPGFNDLATTHPHLVEQALFDPTTVTAGSGKKVPWRCAKGHEWSSIVGSRTFHNLGCPYCSGQRVLAGFNDLATVNPALAREARFDATTVTAHSGRKLPWECKEGHKWSSIVAARSKGVGCPTCAVTGYDPNKPGWLYLLIHYDWEMTQIGITNVPDGRLSDHASRGWDLLDLRGPSDGVLVKEWERSILTFLKRQGVSVKPIGAGGKFSGYTESWWTRDYPVSTIKDLMISTEQDEMNSAPER